MAAYTAGSHSLHHWLTAPRKHLALEQAWDAHLPRTMAVGNWQHATHMPCMVHTTPPALRHRHGHKAGRQQQAPLANPPSTSRLHPPCPFLPKCLTCTSPPQAGRQAGMGKHRQVRAEPFLRPSSWAQVSTAASPRVHSHRSPAHRW